ncbi:response regulator transcription factor [Tomitella gaofuii]|uniref:response regulator transcription factor n=1 Tax=Tomitella gaofuii TaxID=2760083 RepID=UPI0015FD5E77|nr:LuxR C-terminal-related transcriptional regulator [Tomitella gaofuii]
MRSDPTGRPDLPSGARPRTRPQPGRGVPRPTGHRGQGGARPQAPRSQQAQGPRDQGPRSHDPRGHKAGGPRPGPSAAGAPGQAGRPAPALPKPSLSAREVEVLLSWFQSESKAAVSEKLGLAPGTVSTYLSRIRVKYELVGRTANSKAALVARAVQDGLVTLDEL